MCDECRKREKNQKCISCGGRKKLIPVSGFTVAAITKDDKFLDPRIEAVAVCEACAQRVGIDPEVEATIIDQRNSFIALMVDLSGAGDVMIGTGKSNEFTGPIEMLRAMLDRAEKYEQEQQGAAGKKTHEKKELKLAVRGSGTVH